MGDKQWIFSASMLQDYQDCQRRFELKYILRQSWPAIPAEPVLAFETQMARGRQFHFLVHQFFSGIPIETILAAVQDTLLREWFQRFLEFSNTLSISRSFSEFQLSAVLDQHRLIAVFDLLLHTQDGQMIIFDWKTALHKPSQEYLLKKMQSAVYPFVLQQNLSRLFPVSSHQPDTAINMVYWFPEFPDKPVAIDCDRQKQMGDVQFLSRILNELEQKLVGGDFPKTLDEKSCKFCPYRSLCDRGIYPGDFLEKGDLEAEDGMVIDIDFDAISSLEPDI